MTKVIFELSEVIDLVNKSKIDAAKNGVYPTIRDLFDGSLFQGGEPLSKKGLTRREVERSGRVFLPSTDYMDKTKITLKLGLIGSRGVYLTSNTNNPKPPSETGLLAYAKGCDPRKDKGFYDEKCRIFGEDNSFHNIPLDWVERARKSGGTHFVIDIQRFLHAVH